MDYYLVTLKGCKYVLEKWFNKSEKLQYNDKIL